jgi:hypothetical protein
MHFSVLFTNRTLFSGLRKTLSGDLGGSGNKYKKKI